jgi:hypothetical protein
MVDVKEKQPPVTGTSFYQGVQETATVPTYVIDTSLLDKDKLRDLLNHARKSSSAEQLKMKAEKDPAIQAAIVELGKEVRKQLESQGMVINKDWDDAYLAQRFAITPLYEGPKAATIHRANGDRACIVSTPSYDIAKLLISDLPVDFPLKPIAGDPKNYERLAGRHETGHCSDTSSHVGSTATLIKLRGEVTADATTFKEAGPAGSLQVERETMMNVRILNFIHGSGGTGHATAFFIDDKGGATVPTEKSIENLKSLKSTMLQTVAAQLEGNPDVNTHVAEYLLQKNPVAFAALLKQAVEDGKLPKTADNEMKGFINKYVTAVSAQVQDVPSPAPSSDQKADTAPTQDTKADAKSRSVTLADAIPSSSPMVVQGGGKLAATVVNPDTEMKVVDPSSGTVGPPTTARSITNPAPVSEPATNQPQIAQVVKREMA